jgi:hypothetical protein
VRVRHRAKRITLDFIVPADGAVDPGIDLTRAHDYRGCHAAQGGDT